MAASIDHEHPGDPRLHVRAEAAGARPQRGSCEGMTSDPSASPSSPAAAWHWPRHRPALAARGMSVVAAGPRSRTARSAIACARSRPSRPRGRHRRRCQQGSRRQERLVRETVERFGRSTCWSTAPASACPPAAARRHHLGRMAPAHRHQPDRHLPDVPRGAAASARRRRTPISSTSSRPPPIAASPGVSLYAASKFGVRALTEALIEEYRNSGVRVTSVSPGPVDTNDLDPQAGAALGRRGGRRCCGRPTSPTSSCGCWTGPRHMHIPDITVTPWTAAG